VRREKGEAIRCEKGEGRSEKRKIPPRPWGRGQGEGESIRCVKREK